ncbi:MAG: hypothetical protein E7214_06350 [Clostridium sp.]|nr:hypothetical protein [Clostridium sp.]
MSMVIFRNTTVVQKMIISFLCALISTFLFMNILKKIKLKNVIFIPLVGIMVGSIIGSLTEFVAYRFNLTQSVQNFFQGKFNMVMKGNYELLYLTIPLLIIAFLYANKFTNT